MSFLSKLESGIAHLAPIALTVVATVENTLKTAGNATKKSVAVSMIGNLAKVAEASGNATAEDIGGLVDLIVGILNSTGIFTHAAKETAPTPAAPTVPFPS